MYHMKNIVSVEDQLFLPLCMYRSKNLIEQCPKDEIEININDQVIKFLKKMPNTELIELEDRQDKLLLKLDFLYERIKNISLYCKINMEDEGKKTIINPDEIVIVLNSNNLPWFLNKFLKEVQSLNVSWHLHSSVPTDKISIIEDFFRKYEDLYGVQQGAKVNMRLIFKCDSTTPELKISSLAVPILGIVNIIRYLCLMYDNVAPYNFCNHEVDSLLDFGYLLETASEKNKPLLVTKIFLHSKEWIHGDRFSIVDLAIFNVVSQFQNGIKHVPKNWFKSCENLIL